MRYEINPGCNFYKDLMEISWDSFFIQKALVFVCAKTPSPGRVPEGKRVFPGSQPGMVFFIFGLGCIHFWVRSSSFFA